MRKDEIRLYDKIKRFADIRGINESASRKKLEVIGTDLVPKQIYEWDIAKQLNVRESYIVDSITAYISLEDGKRFYGYPSRAREVRLYYLFRDIISRNLSADTYGLAIEILRRYLSLQAKGIKASYYPGVGGVMVDAGAYIGFKAMHYADIVGASGKVLAIEIDKNNAELIRLNAEANNLPIIPVHAAIWNKREEAVNRHRDRTGNTLVKTDQHVEQARYHSSTVVRTDTLNNILNENNFDVIDYLNIQVNGAELQVLEGLDLNRVKVLWIASYYSQSGERIVEKVKQYVAKYGIDIKHENEKGGLLAVNPKLWKG